MFHVCSAPHLYIPSPAAKSVCMFVSLLQKHSNSISLCQNAIVTNCASNYICTHIPCTCTVVRVIIGGFGSIIITVYVRIFAELKFRDIM